MKKYKFLKSKFLYSGLLIKHFVKKKKKTQSYKKKKLFFFCIFPRLSSIFFFFFKWGKGRRQTKQIEVFGKYKSKKKKNIL